jgi:hypothetical protein
MNKKFSQRIGRTPVRSALQIDSIDRDLANFLWNSIYNLLIKAGISGKKWAGRSMYVEDDFALHLWLKFFNNRADEIPVDSFDGGQDSQRIFTILGSWYFDTAQWHEKYDFVEFVVEYLLERSDGKFDISFLNRILEKEKSAYRVIDNKITPITSEQEIQEIELALELSDKWSPVSIHLETALKLLSNRLNPDYRNSVKESISAVEALLRIETGKKKYADAMKKLDKNLKLHASLKAGFLNIYGYTSDEDGIRHAIQDDKTNVSQEDARFMLIACSAFVNYVIAKLAREAE